MNPRKLYLGMSVLVGLSHCAIQLNLAGIMALFMLMWLEKRKITPTWKSFIINLFFTLCAVLVPSVVPDIALIYLKPPEDVCVNIFDGLCDFVVLFDGALGLKSGTGTGTGEKAQAQNNKIKDS